MEIFINFIMLVLASFGMWISSELIVGGVESVASKVRLGSFIVSFVILGILTSVTEISVGINAIVLKKPDIFAGNLIGSSFVIVLFIIPLLAVLNKGLNFGQNFNFQKRFLFLILLLAPAFVTVDGVVTNYDGWLVFLLALFFFYFFGEKSTQLLRKNEDEMRIDSKGLMLAMGKLLFGAGLVYFSSQILVSRTVYFAELLRVPEFLMSLFVLSIGTNLPELAVLVNSVLKKKHEIALANYIGSAVVNVILFAILVLINGNFMLETKHFNLMLMLVSFGFTLFFIFSKSHAKLSQLEGAGLIFIYGVFLMTQISEFVF